MKQESKNFIIGTRGSLLALTQCLQIKEELERISPHKFSLKIIKTEGDENTSLPLWQLDGKDFFTKELDSALLSKSVDMVVHSYKDLGSVRPEGIKLVSVTKREYPNDILFIRKEVIKQLQSHQKKEFIVGTSSPRRTVNLKKQLSYFLPYGQKNNIQVQTKNLRGNINSRLEKLKKGEYDGIVLALPGVERLAIGLKSKNNEVYEKFGNPITILKDLIKDLSFMILPTSTFPAAASQGALGIETLANRDDKGVLENLLKRLNHDQTIEEVKKERKDFQNFGGGCHLAVGITYSSVQGLMRKSLAGTYHNGDIKELSLTREISPLTQKTKAFIGIKSRDDNSEFIPDIHTKKENINYEIPQKGYDLFITSPFVAKALSQNTCNSLWASGTQTMKELANKGHWVHGCADSLGENYLQHLRSSSLIEYFFSKPNWLVLTNDSSKSTLGDTVITYMRTFEKHDSIDYQEAIESCLHFYWTSFPQYEFYTKHYKLSPQSVHYCGIGKTMNRFEAEGISVIPMGSMREFKNYLKNGEA